MEFHPISQYGISSYKYYNLQINKKNIKKVLFFLFFFVFFGNSHARMIVAYKG